MPPERFEWGDYIVTRHHADAERVVVIFASAGMHGLGEPIEEFRKSLSPFGASLIFVSDRQYKWFNHDSTEQVLNTVARWTDSFKYVGVLGESMGGSGSLLFSNYARVDRVLSIAPQFTIRRPLSSFDSRYEWYSQRIDTYYYPSFGQSSQKPACQLLFGDQDWRDCLHQALFATCGFSTITVRGADHWVARYLKNRPERNILHDVIKLFTNFERVFDAASIGEVLDGVNAAGSEDRLARFLSTPSRSRLVSVRKPSIQSSICEHSRGQTVQQDAALGNDGVIKDYGFHTDFEDKPWWRVDLLERCRISQVKLYNREGPQEATERARYFELAVSDDDAAWNTVFTKSSDDDFSGADGGCFVWDPPFEIVARFLRIQLSRPNWLHISQVEIFGVELRHSS